MPAHVVALNRAQVYALRRLYAEHLGEDAEAPESAIVIRQIGGRTLSRREHHVTATIYRNWLPIARYNLDTEHMWAEDWTPREVSLSRRERFELASRTPLGRLGHYRTRERPRPSGAFS
jgi:hypothetical protein